MGYVGKSGALEILLDGLKKLEYRGYDSAGVALTGNLETGEEASLALVKEKGEIARLERKIGQIHPGWLEGKKEFYTGIGHTRWATHGPPSKKNAHPHSDPSGKLALVHNGIIENHDELRKELEGQGVSFISETDTEVVVHLFSRYYRELEQELGGAPFTGDRDAESDFLHKVTRKTVGRLVGSYALVILHSKHPQVLVAARNRSPLVIGVGKDDTFLASDVSPLLAYTRDAIFFHDGDIAVCRGDGITIWDGKGEKVERETTHTDWDIFSADKGGYPHFMLKEIFEQKMVLHETLGLKIKEFQEGTLDEYLRDLKKIEIIACGTSYHAGLIAKYFFEHLANIPVHVYQASEYRYSARVGQRGLSIAITQSGETADTIAAIESAKEFGHWTVAITNILGSTITRCVDRTVYMMAGPEIGVAATKTFTNQLVVLYLLGMRIAYLNKAINPDRYRELIAELRQIPRHVQFVLARQEEIKELAQGFAAYENMLFIGRNISYPVVMEGALKLKEISYIHAESYPAGELKHGPIALLSPETPTVAVVVRDHTYEKTMSNIGEVVARSSPVVMVAEEDDQHVSMYADAIIRIPKIDPRFSPIPASIALQLFAYYIADARNCEIDKPRNLAKSVTVE